MNTNVEFGKLFMNKLLAFAVLLFSFSNLLWAQEMVCDGPGFSNEDLKQHMMRERSVRKDLLPPFDNYTVDFNHKRCHYVYIEYPTEGRAGRNRVFVISRFGDIVDAISGRSSETSMSCPDVDYSEAQLTALLNQQREKYSDLPAAPDGVIVRAHKMRCMFVYEERLPPDGRNIYQVFYMDFYGDVYEFHKWNQ